MLTITIARAFYKSRAFFYILTRIIIVNNFQYLCLNAVQKYCTVVL